MACQLNGFIDTNELPSLSRIAWLAALLSRPLIVWPTTVVLL